MDEWIRDLIVQKVGEDQLAVIEHMLDVSASKPSGLKNELMAIIRDAVSSGDDI